jgi:glycosyltransferase involved in cell wall biosynthesis
MTTGGGLGVAVRPLVDPQPRSLRIGLIGSVKFPQRPPFAGGLEAHTWMLAEGLRDRGHEVTVFGTDAPEGCAVHRVCIDWSPSPGARRDISAMPKDLVAEHHAYLHILRLLVTRQVDVDVVHNNSTHHLPLVMAPLLPAPVVTTLHTPPTPWLESAFALGERDQGHIVSVSHANAAEWAPGTVDEVIGNGVDCELWRPLPSVRPEGAVWFGRLVPEKAPHLAIDAARAAGLPLALAGPVHDPTYFAAEIAPRLGDDVHHVGHLDPHDLAALVASAEVCIVTPVWAEPFGFVVAEALSCGTPVAAFANGALPELVTAEVGCLAPADDPEALADAVTRARHLDRRRCRAHAVEHFSLDAMVDRYEEAFLRCLG